MNSSSNMSWVTLCCDPDELYPRDSICYRNDSSFASGNIYIPSASNEDDLTFVAHFGIPCENDVSDIMSMANLLHNVHMHVLKNGTMSIAIGQFRKNRTKYFLGPNDYCLSFNAAKNKTALFVCSGFIDVLFSVINFEIRKLNLVSLIMLGLPLPFLAATFLVYTILPELTNLHGLILRVYVACLFALHILLMAIATNIMTVCTYSIGVLRYFSEMAVFFWLNVMCFDIWWTFRKCKPLQDVSKRQIRKRFFFYSIYAWGCPALFAGIVWIIEYLPTVPEGIISPEFGDSCWFNDTIAMTIYFDGPIALTLLGNVCFFASTSIKMIKHKKKMAQQFHRSESRWHDDGKNRLKLYLKLFLVMGITRFNQIVLKKFLRNVSHNVFVLINFPNLLQGFAIFIIFVWKGKIKRLLLKRFGRNDWNFCSSKSTVKTDRHSNATTSTKRTESTMVESSKL